MRRFFDKHSTFIGGAMILTGLLFAIWTSGCGGDTTPTRIVCFTGSSERPIFDATVPAKDASLCKWDWGHNGVCVRLGESEIAFGPAHPCTMQRNPPKPPAPPQPSPTFAPSPEPTPVPAVKRK